MATGCLALIWLGAAVLTFTGLLHLANAAERERDTLDHVVDTERTHREFRRPEERELPEVELEGGGKA